jgi:hypothetical protein
MKSKADHSYASDEQLAGAAKGDDMDAFEEST